MRNHWASPLLLAAEHAARLDVGRAYGCCQPSDQTSDRCWQPGPSGQTAAGTGTDTVEGSGLVRSFGFSLVLVRLAPTSLVVDASSQEVDTRDSADQPVVTAAVQVTRNLDPARAHASPQIARNPVTGELVVAETEVRTERTCNVHISSDDGASWSPGGDPMIQPWTDCSGDPDANVNFWLEFDRDGVLYMVFPATTRQNRLFPRRRDNATSSSPVLSTQGGHSTRPWSGRRLRRVTSRVAATATDAHGWRWIPTIPRYVYVTWMNWWEQDGETKNRAMLAASDDGGKTFADPVSWAPKEKAGTRPVRP